MIVSEAPKIELLLADCMEYMATCKDNAFDLAICDPPYGIGMDGNTHPKGTAKCYDYRNGKSNNIKRNDYVGSKWDLNSPDKTYFNELFRVSLNQIIFGMNYYPQYLYHSGAIVWDKKLTGSPMSECEIAFQSFSKLVLKCECEWNGFLKGGEKSKRIHPNQKPIALYRWILDKFAEKGQRVIDTHLGSGSSAIAAHYFIIKIR